MPSDTLDISEARKRFNTLDRDLADNAVIYITRHNKRAFAVVNVDYLSTIMETLEILADSETLEFLKKSIDDIKEGRLHDHEDIKREFL